MAWGSLTTLVKMFAPKAFLDSKEVNFPAATTDFTSQVGYQVYNGQYFRPGWKWSDITAFGPNDFLSVPSTVPSTFQGGNLGDATAYVHVQAVQGQADLVDIQYWLFYNFNGTETLRAEPLLGFSGEMDLPQSNHWGDWECVTVRVNSNLQAVAVCFSQHSTEQWCLPGEMSFTGTQPNVYVSRGSHANRPTAGGPFWIRAFDWKLITFGPVDYADGGGKVVDYSASFVIVANNATQYFADQPPDPGWLKFLGTWGQPLSTTASPGQIVDAIILLAKTVPVMIPFIPALLIIAAAPLTAGALVAALYPSTKNAPTNPPTKGLWQNALPLNPPLSSKFAPALAPLAQSEESNELSLVYVVNASSNQIFAVSSDDGEDWTAAVSVHSQTSSAALCLAPFSGGLCLAFISNDSDHRILTCQSTDGQTWTNNSKTGQTSPARPALAEFNGKLWLAFIANDPSDRLLICSSQDGKSWSDDKQVTGQTTMTGPALAAFNASLWVAFIANNSSNQVLVCSSRDGETWSSNSLVYKVASAYAPALAVFNSKLWLAFIDGDNEMRVTSSTDGLSWPASTQFAGLTSQAAPTLNVFNDTLWLGCINSSNQITLNFSSDGVTWSDGLVIFPPTAT